MTIELKPIGTRCNLACAYCYVHGARKDEDEPEITPDIPAMLAAGRKYGQKFSLFGGEPLLTPKPMLDELFAGGCGGFQTNGLLIDDDHIDLFRRYGAQIGVSIDGPGELNSLRCDVGETERIIANIRRMREAGIAVSIISVMHQSNALPGPLEEFKAFGEEMGSIGVCNINCHFLQGDSEYSLSPLQEKAAFLDLADWLRDRPQLRWQPFIDIASLLTGSRTDQVLCVWHGCDPYTTSAVVAVEADATVRNCGRIPGQWVKADRPGQQRQECLAQTEQQYGGCKGCRFLPLCTGGCPGEAIDGDWRNRTLSCDSIKALFRFYEDALLDQGTVPASIAGQRQDNPVGGCGDHGDAPHGDAPHGDAPHGDHQDGSL